MDGKRGAVVAKTQTGPGERQEYLSYLLRLWRVGDEDKPVWRASLRSALTGKQVGFSSLEALFDYLRAKTGVVLTPNDNVESLENGGNP
jgi:hypothetical protein